MALIPGTSIDYNPSIESILVRVDELHPSRVDNIRRAAKFQVFKAARTKYPDNPLVVRDMLASDLAESNNEWTDTTGSSANAWEAHQIEDQSVAQGRFVAIFGCRVMQAEITDSIPVTALRFNVGGAVVAYWDLYKLYPVSADGVTLANYTGFVPSVAGITESPIIITENMSVKVEQWVATASTTMVLALEGYVCELEGKTLRP